MLIADTLLEEALGKDVVDPVNGVTRRQRNIAVLQRLAVKDGELDPEHRGAAFQINNQAGNDPSRVAAVKRNSGRLRALLRGDMPAPNGIEATVIDGHALPSSDSDFDVQE